MAGNRVGLKQVAWLAAVVLCGFLGARLGVESALPGSRIPLGENQFVSFTNEKGEPFFSLKNLGGEGELNFFVEGRRTLQLRSEKGWLAGALLDGMKRPGLLTFSPDEGLRFIAQDREGRDRVYFSTEGNNPGIMFYNVGEENKAAAALFAQGAAGGSGRLFLATPDYAGKLTGGFTPDETPELTLETADGARIALEIVDGEPSLTLRSSRGEQTRITP